MNKRKKIRSIILGAITISCASFMLLFPNDGYLMLIIFLSISFLYSAIKKLLYYLTMARNMIGGSMILCKGLIELDLAWFISSLRNIPKVYVSLYLVVGLLFSAIVGILKALESKKLKDPSWKPKIMQGICSIMLSMLCLICIHDSKVIIFVFCLGMVQSALIRIVQAFKRKEMVYIQ